MASDRETLLAQAEQRTVHVRLPLTTPRRAMDSFSIWHWMLVIVILAIFGVPIARIIQRTAHSRLWVIAFFVPVLNIMALWTLAFIRWPTTDGPDQTDAPI
jgi:bacteriorhodopsin